jgi:hypothetical protein
MPQEYKDYVFANGGIESQVTPTVYVTAGALTTVSSVYIATPTAAQTTTQSNPFPANAANTTATGLKAVSGPNYYSPGQENIGNPAGGGP